MKMDISTEELLEAHPELVAAAVRLAPSQVGRVGLPAKKGVTQVACSTGTGGSTCSSIIASRASFVMLLNGKPD